MHLAATVLKDENGRNPASDAQIGARPVNDAVSGIHHAQPAFTVDNLSLGRNPFSFERSIRQAHDGLIRISYGIGRELDHGNSVSRNSGAPEFDRAALQFADTLTRAVLELGDQKELERAAVLIFGDERGVGRELDGSAPRPDLAELVDAACSVRKNDRPVESKGQENEEKD